MKASYRDLFYSVGGKCHAVFCTREPCARNRLCLGAFSESERALLAFSAPSMALQVSSFASKPPMSGSDLPIPSVSQRTRAAKVRGFGKQAFPSLESLGLRSGQAMGFGSRAERREGVSSRGFFSRSCEGLFGLYGESLGGFCITEVVISHNSLPNRRLGKGPDLHALIWWTRGS